MSKSEYRTYFADVSRYVKMKNVLEDIGLTTPNFYRFMKSEEYDWCMSVEMLELIHNQVRETLSKLT